MPWLAGDTTYRDHYVPKELALVPVFPDGGPQPFPFDGTTEYRAEYVPKEKLPQVPPLTGKLLKVARWLSGALTRTLRAFCLDTVLQMLIRSHQRTVAQASSAARGCSCLCRVAAWAWSSGTRASPTTSLCLFHAMSTYPARRHKCSPRCMTTRSRHASWCCTAMTLWPPTTCF